jgi:hypothetical protein
MDVATRDLVRHRAGERCEYCQLPDHAIDLPFHVEHVVAVSHQADDSVTNLAWACPRCNLKKGPNLSTIDPQTGRQVELFNPRTMTWADHFTLQEAMIVGVTACGRGTSRLFDMNQEARMNLRRALIEKGEFQPD